MGVDVSNDPSTLETYTHISGHQPHASPSGDSTNRSYQLTSIIAGLRGGYDMDSKTKQQIIVPGADRTLSRIQPYSESGQFRLLGRVPGQIVLVRASVRRPFYHPERFNTHVYEKTVL